jgi:hypothetical protein
MEIEKILTVSEYTKERSAQELFDWMLQKNAELSSWSWEHSDTKELRQIKHRELGKELPNKFPHELIPFAYYAKNYYGDNSNVRFIPCCKSEPYDGIIIDNNIKTFVEITNAIDGEKWGLQKELLIENGHSPWEHNIHGVRGNKTKRNRSAADIIKTNDCVSNSCVIDKLKVLVKEAILKKCKKSMLPKLPYGLNNTILIVTIDDTVIHGKKWDDFKYFKKKEIDSIKHNFKQILLFGNVDHAFIN